MTNAIGTNPASLTALQMLRANDAQLRDAESRLQTGLRVARPTQDASTFSIAQGIRSEIKAADAISQSIANARGLAVVSLAAMTAISDLAGELEKISVQLGDGTLNRTRQALLEQDYVAIVGEIERFIESANFNGRNQLTQTANDVPVYSSLTGTTAIIPAFNFTADIVEKLIEVTEIEEGGIDPGIVLPFIPPGFGALPPGRGGTPPGQTTPPGQGGNLPGQTTGPGGGSTGGGSTGGTVTYRYDSTTLLGAIKDIKEQIGLALGQMGAALRRLDADDRFMELLRNAKETGLGSAVDADLARDSARYRAEQIRYDLTANGVALANQGRAYLLDIVS
ncbi:MAG: flagellin [Oceanibaculum sp.]